MLRPFVALTTLRRFTFYAPTVADAAANITRRLNLGESLYYFTDDHDTAYNSLGKPMPWTTIPKTSSQSDPRLVRKS